MKRWAIQLAIALAAQVAAAGQIALPIYIEDNHAGSFYWLAQHLDLDEPCILLHFDAHSDASAIFDSDVIRRRVRRVASREERVRVLRGWREAGRVQSFNWIEPLMPAPIAQVIWVTPGHFAKDEQNRLEREATRRLDGHLEAAPRVAGSFANRYRVSHLDELEAGVALGHPVIATIDLDYFSGISPNERATEFERVWKFVSERPNLRAITIAISRPYLVDDEEADALLRLALGAALSLPTARIEFAPFRTAGNDESLRARNFRARGRKVPVFDPTQSSALTCALLLANRERIAIRDDALRWEAMLQQWREAAPAFQLSIRNHDRSTDNVWRMSADDSGEIEINASGWNGNAGRVQWFAEVPQYPRSNLTTGGDDRAIFARGAPPRPRWREVELRSAETRLPFEALALLLEPKTGCGAIRLKARIHSEEWIRETPVLEVRRFRGTGFRAALSEQFGLPYLFGSGALRDGAKTGPETDWGADCANFVIYALRKTGVRIPWSNPKQLRRHLKTGGVSFTTEELERGIILHLGSHVAALMEDRPPLGLVNGDDLVAHQLEGAPELLSVESLLRGRNTQHFDVLRVPPAEFETNLLIGGDVMLGRSVGDQIRGGIDPFAAIRGALAGAQVRAVNLECVASPEGDAERGKKFHLRATEAPASLATAGIDLVGLANNHANDFGPAALRDSIRRLREAGLEVIGTPAKAFTCYELEGRRIGFIAIDDSGPPPLNRERLAASLQEARAKADFLIALVHWGEENTARVNERQRELARWLIDHGVDLIAGSHPHCIQPLDFYRGRAVAYSLGNLVFDGAPALASWNTGHLLEVGFEKERAFPSLRLIPVKLDRGGLPHLLPAAATAGR